jgi:hypothetical protein
MNATRLFLGDPAGWKDVQIHLSALQALWGGWLVLVSGDREAIVRHISPVTQEQRFRLALTEADFWAIPEACLENDLLSVPGPTRPGHPDETMIEITLVNAIGETAVAQKWAGDKVASFDAVSRLLFALTARTETLQPVYRGPFQWPKAPTGEEFSG